MAVVFNENDPYAAAWLRNLYPDATVLETDIRELRAEDVSDYDRVHLFGGIGGWEYALWLAGWPPTAPVWTGSCPCQPFSTAGRRRGEGDERHLWPAMYRLVRELRPTVVFGEQVSSADGRDWLARVRADLALLGYAVGAADLAAASLGAPHIRQRLYWVAWAGWMADPRGQRCNGQSVRVSGCESPEYDLETARRTAPGSETDSRWFHVPEGRLPARGVEHPASDGRGERRTESNGRSTAPRRGDSGLADCDNGRWRTGIEPLRPRESDAYGGSTAVGLFQPDSERREASGRINADGPESFWAGATLIPCLDGKTRRTQPGLQPLVDGLPFRLADGRTREAVSRQAVLRGIGNAIVPQVAATFVRAFMESVQ